MRLINPHVCALIGASNNPMSGSYRFLEGWISNKFKGKIYPINPKYSEILGLKVYPDIREVPDEIDYVLIAIPAAQVSAEVKKCVEKRVKFIIIFTSGFREVGNEQFETEILEIAKDSTRILGPNCIGVYSTEAQLGYFKDQPISSPGSVTFISQSGGIARKFIWTSISRGITLRATISIGNTIDVSVNELLTFLKQDSQTQIIGAYLEGIKNGAEFFSILKSLSPYKPVVILKTGRTPKGRIAAQSHTGAIAGSYQLFSALVRQAGGIMVENFEELTDTILSLQTLKNMLPYDNRVAIVNTGGGIAVEVTDLCEAHGLSVANLAPESITRLKSLIPSINTIFDNPIDLGAYGFNPKIYQQVLACISRDPNIDTILPIFEVERFSDLNERFQLSDIGELYTQILSNITALKPVLCILPRSWELIDHFISYKNFANDLLSVGIPSFPTAIRAIKTLNKLIQYNAYLNKINLRTKESTDNKCNSH